MTGETLSWFRVASHLHITVEELAQRITYREFLHWLEYLRWDEQRHSKQDHYLAQIAAEVRRTAVKHPRKIKYQDFLMKFSKKAKQDSKSIWMGFFNIKPKK